MKPPNLHSDLPGMRPLMSKGLGLSYLNEKTIAWHQADVEERVYMTLKDGKKVSMPRYYKERIYWEEERKKIATAARVKHEKKYQEEQEKGAQKKVSKDKASFEKMYRSHSKNSKL